MDAVTELKTSATVAEAPVEAPQPNAVAVALKLQAKTLISSINNKNLSYELFLKPI